MACGQAVRESSFSKIVGIRVDDHTSAEDAFWPGQSDHFVGELEFCDSIVLSDYVSKIANVPVIVGWASVVLSVWIEVSLHAHTTIADITLLVNMETMLSWRQIRNYSFNCYGSIFSLCERHIPWRLSGQDSDSFVSLSVSCRHH